MLSYYYQYGIANGIFLCYDQQLNFRSLSSKHSNEVREKMKYQFPYNKYESSPKDLFVLTCLYVVYNKTPSSFRGMVSEIANVNPKDVKKFKEEIMGYESRINVDINYLKEKHQDQITPQKVINELNAKKINFYTAWFYLQFYGDIDILSKSRVMGHVIRKLKFLMLYLTFKDESVNKIKSLFEVLEL